MMLHPVFDVLVICIFYVVHFRLPELVQDKTGSFLVEQLIAVATPGELAHIYSSIFKGRLLHFTVDKIANYVLQKLLSCVSDKTLVKVLFFLI